MSTTLNENETKVLISLNNEANECTGGEFGYISDAKKCGFNRNEFAGYVSALKAKGVFEYLDTDSGQDYQGQFAINTEFKSIV